MESNRSIRGECFFVACVSETFDFAAPNESIFGEIEDKALEGCLFLSLNWNRVSECN